MSITDGLLAAIEEINNLDKKLARDIGEHIDSQARRLQALKNEVEAKAFATHAFRSLPPAKKEQFEKLKVTELRAIASRMALPGQSKYTRKATIIEFIIDNKAPLAPSYEQLLAFGLSTADKGLVAEERLSKERLAKALQKDTGVCLSK